MGIGYQYEPRLTLKDPLSMYPRWARPDFYLTGPQGQGVVIEYAGMMDLPEYRKRHAKKAWLYHTNQVSMIEVLPEDLKSMDWPASLLERIAEVDADRLVGSRVIQPCLQINSGPLFYGELLDRRGT